MFRDKKVTVCITSFNRFDLLKQTIDSFISLNNNNYPIEKIIVIEDSGLIEMKSKILNEYNDKIELIYNKHTIGQPLALDKMYDAVETEYIFHTEDDYLYEGNSNFLKESVEILEEKKDVHQVWIRLLEDFEPTHGEEGPQQFEDQILQTSSGVQYKMYKKNWRGWSGFSWNPGLRRSDDYFEMFPKGFREFTTKNFRKSGIPTEFNCAQHAASQGYRGAFLLNGACKHMGLNNSTYKK